MKSAASHRYPIGFIERFLSFFRAHRYTKSIQNPLIQIWFLQRIDLRNFRQRNGKRKRPENINSELQSAFFLILERKMAECIKIAKKPFQLEA